MAEGDELLIVDGREGDREGMRKLFEGEGYVCTATGNGREARELVKQKFFPAALVDLDVGRPGAGIDVIRAIRERSRPTAIVLLTGRRSFEAAVDALRLDVVDVVVKRPEEVERLKRAVAVACDRYRTTEGDSDLLRDVQSVLAESFKIMLDMGRKQFADVSIGSGATFRPRVLVVDGDQSFLQTLAGSIQGKPWEMAAEMNASTWSPAARSSWTCAAAWSSRPSRRAAPRPSAWSTARPAPTATWTSTARASSRTPGVPSRVPSTWCNDSSRSSRP